MRRRKSLDGEYRGVRRGNGSENHLLIRLASYAVPGSPEAVADAVPVENVDGVGGVGRPMATPIRFRPPE